MSDSASSSDPSYPVTSLSNSLEIAKAVCDAGGARSGVSKDLIASHIHASPTSGAFMQRMGAARAWGLIDGRGSYRLTPAAEKYFFPADANDRRRALLSFLGFCRVFSELIKRFDGTKLPDDPEMFGNILHREFKIGTSWKMRVAGFFTKAALMAEAIDAKGFLRYRALLDAMDSETQSPSMGSVESDRVPVERSERPVLAATGVGRVSAAGINNVWVSAHDGKTVRVESSDSLTPELWRKLSAYIQVLKPFEEGNKP